MGGKKLEENYVLLRWCNDLASTRSVLPHGTEQRFPLPATQTRPIEVRRLQLGPEAACENDERSVRARSGRKKVIQTTLGLSELPERRSSPTSKGCPP